MTPFLLEPAYKDYLWGGRRLKTEYGKRTEMTPLAESWELSCHPAGPSVAATGPHAGETLADLFAAPGRDALLGTRCKAFDRFPILIKLIDAAKALSIQVHPSDEYALANEDSYGKTEMWVVLDAEPGSFLYFGVARETTKDELRAAIEGNTLETLLARREVHPGDVVFIPAGTIHAIGAGILVAEVQQNSDLTYRVYDFGRLGADGKPRELHIDKAVEVASLTPSSGSFAPAGARKEAEPGVFVTPLASCAYFEADSVELESGVWRGEADGETFLHLLCVGGAGEIACGGETLSFEKGGSVFVPADAGVFEVGGQCRLIVSKAGVKR